MPNTKSAEKALRQSKRRHVRNLKRKRSLKDVLKKFERALAAKNKAEATKLFPLVQKALDKSAKTNILSKNTAGRKKSRLAQRLKKL
ncbi:MAG: 30S ribosomal protein S20 [Candidatus Ryanbacteria bacterium]|nr:30S ribosomal protein S20 [Candidatus Ryanbacteria bacterium]